jgi:hypothetical protein
MSSEGPKINYLLLFLVIAAGVALGNLASQWLAAEVAALQAERAVNELSKSAADKATKAAEAAVSQAQKAAAQWGGAADYAQTQRRQDRDGRRLFQACDDWRNAHAQLKTETTHTEMKKHCGLYERYVEHGLLPAGSKK